MDEAGKGNEPAEQIVDDLVALHRLGKRAPRLPARRQRSKLALVGLGESRAFRVGAVEIAFDVRGVDAGVKVGEIPLGQVAEAGRTFGGGSDRRTRHGW